MTQVTKHFTREELQCKCGCGRMEIPQEFLNKLEKLRKAFGKPMVITSGYRCPAHNSDVSETGAAGPHTLGAVDVSVAGADAHLLLQHANVVGFSGIGIKQKGPFSGRFVHLDDLPVTDNTHPRPRVWTY
jgi:uncharacterized protein YcbK (DUF882 family)